MLAACIGGAVALFVIVSHIGIVTIIRNQSVASLQDVRVIVSGSECELDSLEKNQSEWCLLNPSTESSIELVFNDRSGSRYAKDMDVYIENNYTGWIILTVNPQLEVSVENHIRSQWWLVPMK